MSCFCGYGGLRVLHSFPTRRSSDLMAKAGAHGKLMIVLHSGHSYEIAYKHRQELLDYFANPEIPRLIFQTTDGLWRSEEHTSELQSQSKLVCRLLLEVQKPTQYFRL